MKWVLIYFVALFVASQFLLGCTTPTKTLNFFTPDRIGAGVSQGTMNAYGVGNKIIPNQEQPLEMNFDGETYGTSVWLEWDFAKWEPKPNYDQYLRERIRTLRLEKVLLEKEKDIKEEEEFGTGGG